MLERWVTEVTTASRFVPAPYWRYPEDVCCTAFISGGEAPALELCCISPCSSGQTAPDISLCRSTGTATLQAVSTTLHGPKDNVFGVVTGLCASGFLLRDPA